MAKRGASGLSLLVGIDKPAGMSSHDVVNRVRRVFGEKRVGHTGTLDPFATGVLPICVGPATRLDKYMTGHDKVYRVTMRLGFETTTDDVMGEKTVEADSIVAQHFDPGFARMCCESLKGFHDQVPPQYSAVKINGKKAYEVARKGGEVDIPARRIEVYSSMFDGVDVDEETGFPLWSFVVHCSKGTYIRSLARDLGRSIGCPAHVVALCRLRAGAVQLDDCVSLETLEAGGGSALLDPVSKLGLRYAFVDDVARFVESGTKLYANQVQLNDAIVADPSFGPCGCTSACVPSASGPNPDELVSLVVSNRLKAIYRYDAQSNVYLPDCVFNTPIVRR